MIAGGWHSERVLLEYSSQIGRGEERVRQFNCVSIGNTEFSSLLYLTHRFQVLLNGYVSHLASSR